MGYAIVAIKSKQYMIHPGDIVRVDGHLGEVGKKLDGVDTLLYKHTDLSIGAPHLDVKVALTVLEHTKAKKIRVAKYKAKSRYRKVQGHRQLVTVLHVDAVGTLKAPAKSVSKKSSASAADAKEVALTADTSTKKTVKVKSDAKTVASKKAAASKKPVTSKAKTAKKSSVKTPVKK